MVTRIDSVFQLSNGDRFSYLRSLMSSFPCSYVCLWSLDHNFLICKEGYYQEEPANQLAQTLFEDYKRSIFNIVAMGNDFVPGRAFNQRNPCLEVQEPDLHRFAAIELQRRFYQEARIKVAVFLGCDSGEIELGMSYIPQVNMEMQMQTLFPQDFVTRRQSSSMMELENIPFPTPESTDAALTRAYLAVLSSTQTASTSSASRMSGLQHGYGQVRQRSSRSSAFAIYPRGLGGMSSSSSQMRPSNLIIRRQSMLKRALAFYKGLNYRRLQESRPTSNQLHHMIAERRRREKINESFHALRSLLPPGTKKDKASVLRTTKEYVKSLKEKLMELTKINQQLLEAQVVPRKEDTMTKQVGEFSTNNERLHISITPVFESTSGDQRMADLQVMMRGNVDHPPTELLIRVLGFLNDVRDQVSLVSMDAQTHQQTPGENQQVGATSWATFRLRIEGTEWDESAFKEAIRRILAELAQ